MIASMSTKLEYFMIILMLLASMAVFCVIGWIFCRAEAEDTGKGSRWDYGSSIAQGKDEAVSNSPREN
jgi:hypothetical protein